MIFRPFGQEGEEESKARIEKVESGWEDSFAFEHHTYVIVVSVA